MEQKYLEKLARMILFNIPQNQIAVAINVDESRISQIKATEEYKQIEQQIAAEQYEEQQLINQGWDGVEALGVNRVIQQLQSNPDPDFALRAALAANKATRRGSFRNNPIAQSAGVRAVINLNQVFVNRVNNDSEAMIKHISENKKDTNFLAPNEVQNLLMTDSESGEIKVHRVEDPVTNAQTESVRDNVLDSLDEMNLGTLT